MARPAVDARTDRDMNHNQYIRPVRPDDAEAIVTIYNRYIEETTISFETSRLSTDAMRQRIESIAAHHPYFVYERDGLLLGYCYAHPWKDRAAYAQTLETTVYLAPEAFRQGIGTALMERLIEASRQQGVHVLVACITGDNNASIHLHERLGFRLVSRFSEVGRKFGRWLDVVDMQLILD